MNAFQCFNLTSRNQSSRYLAKLINKEFRKPWFLWQITTKWVFSKSNKCWGLVVDSISSIGWPWPIGNKNSFLGGNSNNAGFEKILKRYCFENILKRYCWPIAVLVKILKSRNLLAEMSTLDGEVTSSQWIYCCLLGLWLFSAIYLLYKCRKETLITNNSYYGCDLKELKALNWFL